jgi:hypothetical protein
METQLSVQSATYARHHPDLVELVFNDGSKTSIYLNDGSPGSIAHDLLDEWIAKGNVISDQ